MTLTIADICGCICAACSVFSVLFQLYEHRHRKDDDNQNLLTACQVEKINKAEL